MNNTTGGYFYRTLMSRAVLTTWREMSVDDATELWGDDHCCHRRAVFVEFSWHPDAMSGEPRESFTGSAVVDMDSRSVFMYTDALLPLMPEEQFEARVLCHEDHWMMCLSDIPAVGDDGHFLKAMDDRVLEMCDAMESRVRHMARPSMN